MSNRHHKRSSRIRQIGRWLASSDGFAAAAAGRGEPAPLLALESYRNARPPELPVAQCSNEPVVAAAVVDVSVALAA